MGALPRAGGPSGLVVAERDRGAWPSRVGSRRGARSARDGVAARLENGPNLDMFVAVDGSQLSVTAPDPGHALGEGPSLRLGSGADPGAQARRDEYLLVVAQHSLKGQRHYGSAIKEVTAAFGRTGTPAIPHLSKPRDWGGETGMKKSGSQKSQSLRS